MHLGRADVLKLYHRLEVRFDESQMEHINLEDLPEDWAEPTMASSVQAVGDAWVRSKSSMILEVPSSAIAGEYNYLLNPQHPDFEMVAVSEILPFRFDPRALK